MVEARKRLGSWLRRERLKRGFSSAAALSRKARIALAHAASIERGSFCPTWRTAARLAGALHLCGPEREEFFCLVDAAGKPTAVEETIYERYVREPVPGVVLWKHLPAALFSVEHDDIVLFDLTADDLVADVVRALGSLLAWVHLRNREPGSTQFRRLRTAAKRAFDQSLHLPEVVPVLGPINPTRAACDAASVLPRAWRNELFARRQTTARLVLPLRKWAYHPRGFPAPARVGAWLRDERLNMAYSFTRLTVETIINVHDSLVADRLWSLLNLTSTFGVTGQSAQEYDLAMQLTPHNGDLFTLLRARADDPTIAGDAADAWERRDELRAAAERVDLALRLYELPDLAQRVLQVPRAEVEAGLTRAVDLVGGISARFPGPPIGRPPSTPRRP